MDGSVGGVGGKVQRDGSVGRIGWRRRRESAMGLSIWFLFIGYRAFPSEF